MPQPSLHPRRSHRGALGGLITLATTAAFVALIAIAVLIVGLFHAPETFGVAETPTASMTGFFPEAVTPTGNSETRDMASLFQTGRLLLFFAFAVSVAVWGSLKGLTILAGRPRRSVEWMLGASPRHLIYQGLSPWPKGIILPLILGLAAGGFIITWVVATRPEGVTFQGTAWVPALIAAFVATCVLLLATIGRLRRERSGYGGLTGANAGRGTESPQVRFRRTLVVGSQGSVSIGLVIAASLVGQSGRAATMIGADEAQEDTLLLATLALGNNDNLDVDDRVTALKSVWENVANSQMTPETLATPGAWNGRGPEIMILNVCGRCFTGGMPHPVHAANVRTHIVYPGFLDTRTSVLEGRSFDETDTTSTELVAVVSTAYARAHFQDGGALGKGISLDGINGPWHEVVGIVEGSDISGLGHSGAPYAAYFTALQHPPVELELLLRVPNVSGEPRETQAVLVDLAERINRQAVNNIPGNPLPRPVIEVQDVRTLASEADRLVGPSRWLGRTGWGMGLGVAILGALGLFSAISHHVGQRRAELGIRSALGATPHQLRLLVMKEATTLGFWLTGIGLWAGLALAAPTLSGVFGMAVPRLFLLVGSVSMLLVVGAALPAAREAGRAEPRVAMAREG